MPLKRYPWRYAAFLLAYYAANALYQGYVTLYLKSAGLDSRAIGLIQSALPVAAVSAQLIWGSLSDKSANRVNALKTASFLAGGVMFVSRPGSGFCPLLAALFLFNLCYPALQPMGDSIILEALDGKWPYGKLRLLASLAFAASSLLFGYVFEAGIGLFPLLTGAMLLAVALSTAVLPPLKGHGRQGRGAPLRALFYIPYFRGLLLLFMALQLTVGYYFSFFPLYFTALPGATEPMLGYAYMIATLCEAPFLLAGDRLFERLGAGRLLAVSTGALFIRWALLFFLPSVPWAMAGQVLHAGGFIVFTFSMAKFISRAVPKELRARGQAVLAVAGYGAARVIGNSLGGILAGRFGPGVGFAWAAGICLAAFGIGAPFYFRKPPITGENPAS